MPENPNALPIKEESPHKINQALPGDSASLNPQQTPSIRETIELKAIQAILRDPMKNYDIEPKPAYGNFGPLNELPREKSIVKDPVSSSPSNQR